MSRLEHDTPRVPDRKVLHDFEGDEFHGYDLPRGAIDPLPMNPAAKAAARRRRERLNELGGFGFGAAA